MSTAAAQAPAQKRIEITDQRSLGLVALSALALVTGLAVWFASSTISYDGENTGTWVGVLVASIGLTFFFPALKTYLLARQWVWSSAWPQTSAAEHPGSPALERRSSTS